MVIMYISGCGAILLGAETLRGLYPVETISTVGKICAEVYCLSPLHLFGLILAVVDIFIWCSVSCTLQFEVS